MDDSNKVPELEAIQKAVEIQTRYRRPKVGKISFPTVRIATERRNKLEVILSKNAGKPVSVPMTEMYAMIITDWCSQKHSLKSLVFID